MDDEVARSTMAAGDAHGRRPELLAPAGQWESLEAAIAAGASAVYFGMTTLNARRRARNFSQEELPRAVALAHGKGVRVYLTLNIDLAQRELGQAARILELARQAGVDGVLVRDPALLALRRLYPQIEFHFSTQSCMANSADVEAAGELGAGRVVLARELTLEEIAAASGAPGVQTEVFVQGALCFCVSGRCLLSSWAGGRSGNRGACTSPCRVPWSVGGEAAGTPLSMRDLATVRRLEDLRRAGVAALKIEGRLKTAAWVGRAVSLYRRALDGAEPAALAAEAQGLGAYTGRMLTDGYLDGHREDLTALAEGRMAFGDGSYPGPGTPGRTHSVKGQGEGMLPHQMTSSAQGRPLTPPLSPERRGEGEDERIAGSGGERDGAGMVPASTRPASGEGEEDTPATGAGDTFDLRIDITDKAIVCCCTYGDGHSEWTMPRTVVRRQNKAVKVGELLKQIARMEFQGCRAGKVGSNDEEFFMVPRATNALVDRLSPVLRQLRKPPDETIRIDLPQGVREVLIADKPSPENDLCLGGWPDRARLEAGSIAGFLKAVRASGVADARPSALIVENLTRQTVAEARAACAGVPMIVALPQVFFEGNIAGIRELLAECHRAGLSVEVNTWGGWRLARAAKVRMESGPGMGVLNSLAARVLRDAGIECVTLSLEAERRQLEDITAHCPVPCSLVVFGRPVLMTTRVEPDPRFAHQTFADRRDVKMILRREGGLWTFRPVEPFDLRRTSNERIKAAHLVADLTASTDPASQWLNSPRPGSKPFRFNYDRTLA